MSMNSFVGGNHCVDVIAHRGGAGEWPAETLYAFRKAVALGVDVLEMDVRATSDNKLVLMHNFTVNETTNGNGPVRWLSLKTLKTLDAGYNWTSDMGLTHPFRGLGISVPTLEETFQEFNQRRMNIEIKGWHPFSAERIIDSFVGLLKDYKMMDRVLVASFHKPALNQVRRQCPTVAISASTFDILRFVASSKWGARGYKPDAEAIQTYNAVIDANLVQMSKALGLKLHGWTVNDTDEMQRLIQLGVDGIITDFPTKLMEVVKHCRDFHARASSVEDGPTQSF
jgi:glycerophosphoryl diester phosphodiesterase